MKKNMTYMDSVHHYGRIWGLIVAAVLIAFPLVLSLIFKTAPDFGVLLAGLDNGINFLFDDDGSTVTNKLPFNPLKDEKLMAQSMKNDDGIQFSHTIEEQIGGQLRAGFMLTDVYEDTNGYGVLQDFNVPTFWATRAVKK